MADPLTLAMVSMGASGASGLMGAVSSIMGGSSQSSMYKYQAGSARVNAGIARENAAHARYAGEFEAQRSGMKTRYERGKTTAIQSGRGVVTGQGSAGGVIDSITKVGAQEQSTIRGNAARRAYGFEVEAAEKDAAANMYGKAAQRSKLAGYLGAGSSLLSSAASVSSKWMQAGQAGIFSDTVGQMSPDFPYEA